MQDTLKPAPERFKAGIPLRKLPIFTFTGRAILPRQVRVRTLGDALDYGYSVLLTCGCKRTVHQLPAASFLALKSPVPESVLIRDLADFTVCRRCGEKADVQTVPTNGSYSGIRPRKAYLQGGYLQDTKPYEPAMPLAVPKPDDPENPPPRRTHRKRYR